MTCQQQQLGALCLEKQTRYPPLFLKYCGRLVQK
jgi:hypothetical protein